ncbi:MAG: transaldolase [Vulcanimicrobiota bacterium]
MANPLSQLHSAGVSVWLDFLSRDMLTSGELVKRIERDSLRGQTSNPTIFEQVISEGDAYDDDIRAGVKAGKSAEDICWELMASDVQDACDVFRPLYEESGGEDGYVSLELNPEKAHDTAYSISQAEELWGRVDRPNLMLKVPGTKEGLPVIEELIWQGMNVNVTLLFAVERYEEVMDAFMKGLERRLEAGKSVKGIASVASFFISRVESEVDKRLSKLDGGKALQGQTAVANARMAYKAFQERFASPRWKKLEAAGASLQRPLWASTSTKNPDYKDTMYVDELIGPHCVNTMPDATIEAFADHGTVERTLTAETIAQAAEVLKKVSAAGVDLEDVTLNTLVVEGVRKFADSYKSLLSTLEDSMKQLERVAS